MAKVVFRNAYLLDGENPGVEGATIEVEGDRIVRISSGPVEFGADDRVVDCAGRTLMPGMVSGHFHSTYRDVGSNLMPPVGLERPPAYQAYVAAENAKIALRTGVTSVVGANESYDIDGSLRDAINEGLLIGPRVIPGSRDLITTADSNDTTPWWWESRALAGTRVCDGPDEFRKAVRDEIRRGAEIVKLFASGGHGIRLARRISSVTQAELNAAVEAAHGLGKRARAHVASKRGIMACLKAGVDVIDHGDGLDEECIVAMTETGAVLCPSIHASARRLEKLAEAGAPIEGPMAEVKQEFEEMCEILPEAASKGIPICLGDDYGGMTLHHGDYGRELSVYVQYVGISPLEAIKWATINGGALVGLQDLKGIREGAIADMIVVEGDPSRNPWILSEKEKIGEVMRDGQLFFDRP